MRRPSASTLGFIAIALGWAIFAAIYAGVPVPNHFLAPPKGGIDRAVASFDHLHYARARRDFAKLAGSGDATAEMWLGYMDEHGFGAERNPSAAIAEYTTAADANSVVAARRLGEMYLRGDGVLQDVATARKWLERAAIAGDTTAQRDLGNIYANGTGVPQDEAQAYAWLDIAASHGDALAARERDRVLATLSPDAVGHAQHLAQATEKSLSRSTVQARPGAA